MSTYKFVTIIALYIIILSEGFVFADNNSRTVRNTLFSYHILLNRCCDRLYYTMLKNIDFHSMKFNKPLFALCSIKCAAASSKSDREMFLKSIAAVIYCVNEIILKHRKFVKFVQNKSTPMSSREHQYFDMICSFYQSKDINELLERILPVPVSLAAAQAALESGFGSCQYMNTRNAFFGMIQKNDQLIPFDTVFESAIAYTKTLNVNPYYKSFRKIRKLMVCRSQKIDGYKLSGYVGKYSTNKKYQYYLKSIIQKYNLVLLDTVCLY